MTQRRLGRCDQRHTAWWVVTGVATADAERVVVSVADREGVEAQLADTGPADGWRWFAVVVTASTDGRPAASAIAFDAAGNEIASGATQ